MYKSVPTTCFGPFWLGHHQVMMMMMMA